MNNPVIEAYIDKSLHFIQKHKEYLMYLPFWEGSVAEEMKMAFDRSSVSLQAPNKSLVQPGKTKMIVNLISEKDEMWQVLENSISENEIEALEKELNILLPKSYKQYLQYKHYYSIFFNIEMVLFPKPVDKWKSILLENNLSSKEQILDKGYFSIGDFSDYGKIALELKTNEKEEGRLVVFDTETGVIAETLSEDFLSLLSQILEEPEPQLVELKAWKKKFYK